MRQRKPERLTTLHRALWLAKMLRRGKPFTAVTAAAVLHTDARTAKRDLRLLRDLGWRIAWDAPDHTYTLVSAPKATLI